MSEWQTIDTAPKDEWIAVHIPYLYTIKAKWIYDKQWQYGKDENGVYQTCEPTHWMPLPACPAEK